MIAYDVWLPAIGTGRCSWQTRYGLPPSYSPAAPRKRACGRLRERFSGGSKLAVPWPRKALGTANATINCVRGWSGVSYRWGKKSIMEMTAKKEKSDIQPKLCTD
jgi:hypothetical protein